MTCMTPVSAGNFTRFVPQKTVKPVLSENNSLASPLKMPSAPAPVFTGACQKKSMKERLLTALTYIPLSLGIGVTATNVNGIVSKSQVIHQMHSQNPQSTLRAIQENVNVKNSLGVLETSHFNHIADMSAMFVQHAHNVAQAVDNTEPGSRVQDLNLFTQLSLEDEIKTRQFYLDLKTGNKDSYQAFNAWADEVLVNYLKPEQVSQAKAKVARFREQLKQETSIQAAHDTAALKVMDDLSLNVIFGLLTGIFTVPAHMLSMSLRGNRQDKPEDQNAPNDDPMLMLL